MTRVPDPGHWYADKRLAALAKKLQRSYRQASLSLQEKISAYMEQFEKEDTMMRALYDSGELSHADYMAWRYQKIAGTKQWRNMLDQLTTDLVKADKTAASMIRDELPEVYAENHNYGTYEIEHDSQMSTSYTLYNRDAVKRLLEDDPDLLPQPRVDIPKAERWNRQHLQSAVTQGILSGESMRDIAKRFQMVADMDRRAAMRNARTAVTGAENAGKLDSMKRAQGLGVQLKKLWLATRDSRTRDSHVLLDGELRETDEPFSNGCMYPGDPDGAPAEVYNCRCAMRSKVTGADPYSPDLSRNQRLGGMSYEEWKDAHAESFYSKQFSGKNAEEGIATPKGSKISDIVAKIKDKIFPENPVPEIDNDDDDEEYKAFESRNVETDLSILCKKIGVSRVKVHKLKELLTEEEIIDKICVDDNKGYCVSLAYAYAANKVGLDVTDNKGGFSRGIFSNFGWTEIADSKGVVKIENSDNANDFVKVGWLLGKMDPNKEYILSVASHTAVVRKNNNGFEYLELQTKRSKGFHKLDNDVLKNRFKCSSNNSTEIVNLVDIESLRDNDEFRAVAEYINNKGR